MMSKTQFSPITLESLPEYIQLQIKKKWKVSGRPGLVLYSCLYGQIVTVEFSQKKTGVLGYVVI